MHPRTFHTNLYPERKAEQIYVMANNHFRGQAPVNALQLRAALSGEKVGVPPVLLARYPVLKDVARGN